MLACIDLVGRKPQDLHRVGGMADGNEEHFSLCHRVHVKIATYPGNPGSHDPRRVIRGTDRSDGVQVSGRNVVNVAHSGSSNVKRNGVHLAQNIAMGLTGLPVPRATLSGSAMNMNSYRRS